MIKTFCDSCGKEILKGDEVASITSIENQYTMESNPQKQPIQTTRLACDDCFKKIKKILYAKQM